MGYINGDGNNGDDDDNDAAAAPTYFTSKIYI